MRKLFWDDAYLSECTAKVTQVDGTKVRLDQSVFYAFSGGQESDKGTIGSIEVLNAVKEGDKEDVIDIEYELASKPPFTVGDEVIVEINPKRRDNLRKLHSVTHLVYYFLKEKLGAFKVVGSHVAEDKARIDITSDNPITDVVAQIEQEINTFLAQDHKIVTEQDPSKPDLRWWKCEEWKMPCGGTHVRSTAEIGKVELIRKTKGAGKERIEIRLA